MNTAIVWLLIASLIVARAALVVSFAVPATSNLKTRIKRQWGYGMGYYGGYGGGIGNNYGGVDIGSINVENTNLWGWG
ncbi:hypothetical protein Tcan_16056 [Toxocara canis]|uniref:Uncharacterized protein n=2 Tax=Toxocara canis TaxID=6265 RepID=A0A0B2VDB9_TOXCA|nr:hypothetical protein Tcan_16056 [Toxocara canis]VDM23882.1 unnamed protein product [Toxocara canis]